MPPIAATKSELDGYFNRVYRSIVVLIRLKNGNAVNFGTGFVVSSGRYRVLVCVEKKLIKEDESIAVRFYEGTQEEARVFMQKTAFRHAVLEVKSRLRPPPVTFSDFEVTRQDIFTVAAVHMRGALGLMTGTIGNPNCKAVNTSGQSVYRSESTFAMSCPTAGPSKMPEKQVIMEEPEEILKLIGAPVFDTNGLAIGTIETADPYSPNLKFAIKTMFFVDKLETYLKKIDQEISLLRGKGGLSQGTGTSKLCDTTAESSNRKRGRGNAPPSGTGKSKTVCINQVEGNTELHSESNMVAIRREAVERALMRLVTKESDDVWRSSTNSVARNPGEGDSDKIIAIEPFDLNDFFGGDGKINGYKSLKNGSTHQVEKIVEFLNEGQIASANVVDAVISPPYVFLPIIMDKLRPEIQVAAQNCWVKKGGAFTGEASAEMLANLGIPWVILGQSERRSLLGESSEFVGDKAAYALAKGLKVITCVGETREQREAGLTTAVVAEQTRAIADKITDWSNVVIAYEPVWAIGTVKVATPAQAQEVHANLRDWLKTNVSPEVAESTRIIYGGPVTGASSKEFAAQPDIEGFLVCGATLKPEFIDIISTAIIKYA